MVLLATVADAELRNRNNESTGKATKKTTAATKNASTTTPAATKPPSQIDAALAVLKKSRKPLSCKKIVEAMAKKARLWTSRGRQDA